MSDTPRTDAAILRGECGPDFCRELEREMERLRAGWIESNKIALAARIKDAESSTSTGITK